MAEDSQDLPATLHALREQLTSAKNLSPELRADLRSVIADIDRALEEPADEVSRAPASAARAQHDSIVARLAEAAREFEETHPTLSGTIGSVIDALGQMGV